MPTKFKDYPLYTYDEPAVYSNFSCGINTDPSNEHLIEGEMRDCVNMHYLSGALVKRKGAKKLCDISCEDDLFNIQGIFLFTYKITYIIVAANGKLYQGIFNDDAPIVLTKLYIHRNVENYNLVFDPENSFAGLEEKTIYEIDSNYKHEGYIERLIKDTKTNETFAINERGTYEEITGGLIQKGDVFNYYIGIEIKKYLCIKDFEKEIHIPVNSDKWEEIDKIEYYSKDGSGLQTLTVEEYKDLSQEEKETLQENGVYIKDFNEDQLEMWHKDSYCFYNDKFYLCLSDHYNRSNSLNDEEFFCDLKLSNKYIQQENLVFQNYRKVEAATFNNKLYIATGTRLVEVYLFGPELIATPVSPYLCNYTEVTKIGHNYMSPYPELAVASQLNTVTTSITGLKVTKTIGGSFILTPVMNIQIGDSLDNYYYRWEKFINGKWHTFITFMSQYNNDLDQQFYSIEVNDADKYQYRVTFAKSFEMYTNVVPDFNIRKSYNENDLVSVNGKTYKCIRGYNIDNFKYMNNTFQTGAYLYTINEETQIETLGEYVKLWEEILTVETLPYVYKKYDDTNTNVITAFGEVIDLKIDKADGEYFGSATSVLFNNDLEIAEQFELIHSCNKIIVDGQKLILYGDKYNSGQWFKTVINNPGYVTDRGSLSFKTTKNESLIKVVPFQGNLIVFANSEDIGGSIHLVRGNGDDYNDQSGYYSPYQRSTINASVSCNNPDTVQICDNLLVFKYFDRVYYINASELNNDVVKVMPCNDRVLTKNQEVNIPWEDNDCISEITDTYYALIWKEKYTVDKFGELVLQRPGTKVKMYYKMDVRYNDNSYGMPWLRDESKTFNIDHIIYVKGKPIYLYNNILLSFNEECYQDLNENYKCKIHLKGEGLNYPQLFKLINNITVGFHRNQFNKIDLNVIIKNEAGHSLINSDSKRKSISDLAAMKLGIKHSNQILRLDSTIQDTKLINSINMFPCLLADSYIEAETEGSFAFSSISFVYTTIEYPDTNPYDVYTNIIRPKEVK